MNSLEVASSYTSLENLVSELARQQESKVDFIADSRMLGVTRNIETNKLHLVAKHAQAQEFLPHTGVQLRDRAIKQLGSRTAVNIPPKFLMELARDQTPIASTLLNDLMQATPKKYLVRMLDGHVRCCLSDRYRVLDNYDLAFTALDAVKESNGQVLAAWITDDAMSIQFTTQELWDQFNEGEKVHGKGSHYFDRINRNISEDGGEGDSVFNPLVTITNSETGAGGLNVRYGLLRARCVNRVIIEDATVERHLGRTLPAGWMSRETIDTDARSIMLKARDAVQAGLHPATFNKIIAVAKNATEVPVEAPKSAINNIVKAHNISDTARDDIMAYFLKDYPQTAYGLSQAVSRYGQDVPAEQHDDFASVAGQIMKKPEAYATA